ncbi:hypothetical protein MN116_002424 [Schistosoma mekongi]|uniref:Protein kinase domain-containing protein n=1 Tax=Schistosoma mekongi TaxID=38744 RepID=A0AAE2D8K7_SCHME|nr:hypothetical protein MN116_002424 [Schistosoma mekongi]
MYADELSNSVQSIDLQDTVQSTKESLDAATCSEDSDETSIQKSIKTEAQPILPPGYQISHCLAEGGIGRVYLIVNPDTKDCLAAKVVNVFGQSSLRSNPKTEVNVAQVRADLRQEAELQRRLKHHNIATLYGIRNTPTFTFMFMELLPGGELFERIPIGIGLHVQQMFIYYAQILDALNYLHNDQQIAHLDVKPENIMLTKKDRAKLIDFGWAVDMRKQKLIQGPVGTTSYAAPEVFGKNPYFGPPADLFSLGVTLLTAVTGQRCWSRASYTTDPVYRQWTEHKDLHTGPVFSRLPPDLANFLTRALAHRPSDRLTIECIRKHPWYRLGLARRLTPVASPRNRQDSGVSDNTVVPNSDRSNASRSTYQSDAPVPSSQPTPTCHTQWDSLVNNPHLSQPVDTESMLMASQMVGDIDYVKDRLGFSCLMRRMTRFFSALSSVEHTMEVIRAVVVQRRHLRATIKGSNNLLVDIKTPEHPGTAFRVLLYPLAGSILVDCRRVSGDGLLFHQTYAAIYTDLSAMGAVNITHPYLHILLPERPTTNEPQNNNNSDSNSDNCNSENSSVYSELSPVAMET